MPWLDNEPVLKLVLGVGTVIQAGLALLLAFDVKITPGQVLAINTFTAALIAWVTRGRTSSIAGTKDGSTIYPVDSVKQQAVMASRASGE